MVQIALEVPARTLALFEYLDTDTVSDVEYPDSNTDKFEPH